MKTILGTLLALGLLTSAASANWCSPGYGHHRTTHAPAPVAAVPAPAAPVEPAPVAPPPAPEAAPPK